MFFNLTTHPSPTPRLQIYVTADLVLWCGKTPNRALCVGSVPHECLPEDPQNVVNWAEA
jgi:hypothetical protein